MSLYAPHWHLIFIDFNSPVSPVSIISNIFLQSVGPLCTHSLYGKSEICPLGHATTNLEGITSLLLHFSHTNFPLNSKNSVYGANFLHISQ